MSIDDKIVELEDRVIKLEDLLSDVPLPLRPMDDEDIPRSLLSEWHVKYAKWYKQLKRRTK
jgi:hypothetical protein